MMNNDGGREVYCWGGGEAGGTCMASLVRDVPVRPLTLTLIFFKT